MVSLAHSTHRDFEGKEKGKKNCYTFSKPFRL